MQLITQQEVMWHGIKTELGLRLTEVQYNGRSYGSWCNIFYSRNTVTSGNHIEINRGRITRVPGLSGTEVSNTGPAGRIRPATSFYVGSGSFKLI